MCCCYIPQIHLAKEYTVIHLLGVLLESTVPENMLEQCSPTSLWVLHSTVPCASSWISKGDARVDMMEK